MILSVWGFRGFLGSEGSQSALREGLLDFVQNIPQQRWLVALGVDGDGLIGLGEREMRG